MVAVIIIFVIIIVAVIIYNSNNQSTTPKKQNISQAQMMDVVRNIASQSENKGFYWDGYKARKPRQAQEIEDLLERDLSKATDVEAFEIVTTIERWSKNAGKPISALKEVCLKEIKPVIDEFGIDPIIERFKHERLKEANTFNISQDNTVCAFMLKWLIDIKTKSEMQPIKEHLFQTLEDKGIHFSEDDIQKTIDELNLAPDISKEDREENRLLAVAKEGVDFISDNYKHLDEKGRIEALLYCTTCLIDLRTDYENSIDMDIKEDRYFLLLHDEILCADSDDLIDDTISFINSRISFYKEQKRKLSESSYYTPMFIHNAFYESQLSEHPEIMQQVRVSPVELMMLQATLAEANSYLQNRKSEVI